MRPLVRGCGVVRRYVGGMSEGGCLWREHAVVYDRNATEPVAHREPVWHVAIAAVITASLLIQLWLIFTGGADANSGEGGRAASIPVRLWRLFSFFTVESNIVVLIV